MQQFHCKNPRTLEVCPHAIMVPTVTLVVASEENPYMVLIAKNSKHEHSILPGGKIDQTDLEHSLISTATNSARRELKEETGLDAAPRLLFVRHSMEDMRSVLPSSLQGTIVESEVAGLPKNESVLAYYGYPDYVFLVKVPEQPLLPTSELDSMRWVHLDEISSITFSAGHKTILTQYRALIEHPTY